MKKILVGMTILAIVLLAFGVASPTFAAESLRGGPGNGGGSTGNGRSGNGSQRGDGTGVPVERNIALDGVLSDLIHENLAAALDISSVELAEQLEAGETVVEIGLSLGFDLETINVVTDQARTDALAQAVEAGLITQEQADWLAARGGGYPNSNNGAGVCDGTSDCLN